MSYKRQIPLDIPEETDLTLRQLTSPILEEVPAWIIKHICSEDYFRTPKRPPKVKSYTESLGVHAPYGGPWEGGYENSPTTGYRPHGQNNDGSWAERMQAISKARNKRFSRMALKDKIEKGNLPNQDYRFWEGSRSGDIVHCRFCGFKASTEKARQDHFKASGLFCSHKLKAIFDGAVKNTPRFCFACGVNTRESMWGIPLHRAEKCLTDWKFNSFRSHHEFARRKDVTKSFGGFRDFEMMEARIAAKKAEDEKARNQAST